LHQYTEQNAFDTKLFFFSVSPNINTRQNSWLRV